MFQITCTRNQGISIVGDAGTLSLAGGQTIQVASLSGHMQSLAAKGVLRVQEIHTPAPVQVLSTPASVEAAIPESKEAAASSPNPRSRKTNETN